MTLIFADLIHYLDGRVKAASAENFQLVAPAGTGLR
jgi:hypothetical protein